MKGWIRGTLATALGFILLNAMGPAQAHSPRACSWGQGHASVRCHRARRAAIDVVEGPPITVNGQPVTDYKHGYLLTPAYLSAPQVGLPILGIPVPPALAFP